MSAPRKKRKVAHVPKTASASVASSVKRVSVRRGAGGTWRSSPAPKRITLRSLGWPLAWYGLWWFIALGSVDRLIFQSPSYAWTPINVFGVLFPLYVITMRENPWW